MKIDFQNQKVNLFNIATLAYTKKLDHSLLLKDAFNQEVLTVDENKLLLNFIDSIKDMKDIKSQLYQDVFAAFIIGEKFDKTFLEFGATNGFDLSNSYMLEKSLGWKGTLSEPSTQWHDELRKNRPFSDIITDCIWSESGMELNFFMSDIGIASTLDAFKESDRLSMPRNTDARIKSGKNIYVKTISLNDVMQKNFKGRAPSYISIDTEGSEYQILSTFDFSRFRPVFFTVEHNFTNQQQKIDNLMQSNNYVRIFKKITAFDAWYVSSEALTQIKDNIY
jgi:FkbM family methyltransferase